jgi:hypothetical protein
MSLLNVRTARYKLPHHSSTTSVSFSTITALAHSLFTDLDLGTTPSERFQALRNLPLKDEIRPLLPLLNLVIECGIPETEEYRFKLHNRGLFRSIAMVFLHVLRARMGKMIQVVAFVVENVQVSQILFFLPTFSSFLSSSWKDVRKKERKK